MCTENGLKLNNSMRATQSTPPRRASYMDFTEKNTPFVASFCDSDGYYPSVGWMKLGDFICLDTWDATLMIPYFAFLFKYQNVFTLLTLGSKYQHVPYGGWGHLRKSWILWRLIMVNGFPRVRKMDTVVDHTRQTSNQSYSKILGGFSPFKKIDLGSGESRQWPLRTVSFRLRLEATWIEINTQMPHGPKPEARAIRAKLSSSVKRW